MRGATPPHKFLFLFEGFDFGRRPLLVGGVRSFLRTADLMEQLAPRQQC
jgi:hypothetical protein